jgi:serine/threonine protein kinase
VNYNVNNNLNNINNKNNNIKENPNNNDKNTNNYNFDFNALNNNNPNDNNNNLNTNNFRNTNINKNTNNQNKPKFLPKNNKEISLQTKIKHKNITAFYGVYSIPDSSCMVMELAKYGDLDYFQKKFIQKSCLSETLLAYISKQILNGLSFLHQSKIIHMDIKHQNILIDKNLQIKLTDLSVSFSYSNQPQYIVLPVAGTSLFMSPEILGKKQININDCNKIDIFSLGILLYNLAFGSYPYGLEISDKRNFELMFNKINTNSLFIPKIEKLSSMFRDFLSGLLNKDISKRLSINEALNHPWIKAANEIFIEKEKINDLEKFLINLVTDNIKAFNDYINS